MARETKVPEELLLELSGEELGDLERTSRLEWLETNGLGGWASSTVCGALTRRYHGLLVAATAPPVGRTVLLAKLDETLHLAGEPAGTERHELGTNFYPDVVHPRGFERLVSFRLDPFPTFEFAAQGVRLRKTVGAIYAENTTVVLYEVLAAHRPFGLELRPLFAGRDYHALERADHGLRREARFEGNVLSYVPRDGVPETHILVPGGTFAPRPDWYYAFELREEAERGFEPYQDLFTPGSVAIELAAGSRLAVVISCDPPAGRDGAKLLAAERRRRARLVQQVPPSPLCRTLARAADQFVVRRGAGGHTVIAGYPWFADWGRDTMIALPGLCLVTGRLREAGEILRAFAAATSQGMLPNRFPDIGDEPEYNTADASLWFFVAVERYLAAGGDESLVRGELWPVLEEILDWHRRGTRYDIHQDADGLLYAGTPGVQLTWMDAKVDHWVVTPRQGKAVEINSLWLNAFHILAALRERFGDETGADALRREARRIRRRFSELFWSEEDGYLIDCIDQRDGAPARAVERSLRPNQLVALALPYPALSQARARKVLGAVEARLLTPVGLRTLSPDDPAYRPRYEGGPLERDGAYHQGTVWPWLLGPYFTALVRLRGKQGRARARRLFEGLAPHLGEAGLGSVSEIFDAEPPHTPRGCPAQAWSVAELLRAAIEDLELGEDRAGAAQTGPRGQLRSGRRRPAAGRSRGRG